MQITKTLVAMLVSTSLASCAALQPRSMTAAEVVKNIKAITKQSLDLQPIVTAIPTGGTLLGKRQNNPFSGVINGLQAIINAANTDTSAMGGMQPFATAEAQKICTAFHDFVVVHQELLKLIIGKSGILESIFLGPVAATLRSLESVVDELAFGIIDAVPTCQAGAEKDKSNLDTTLGDAVCAYTPAGTLGIRLFC